MRIPSTEAYPSFNLSQSVLLALSELSRLDWAAIALPERELPEISDFVQLDRLVAASAARSGYFNRGTPRPIPQMVKHLIRRIDPDEREMGILMGLFGKIDRALAGKIPIHPLPEESEQPPAEKSRNEP